MLTAPNSHGTRRPQPPALVHPLPPAARPPLQPTAPCQQPRSLQHRLYLEISDYISVLQARQRGDLPHDAGVGACGVRVQWDLLDGVLPPVQAVDGCKYPGGVGWGESGVQESVVGAGKAIQLGRQRGTDSLPRPKHRCCHQARCRHPCQRASLAAFPTHAPATTSP